jgi:hypothetical protein
MDNSTKLYSIVNKTINEVANERNKVTIYFSYCVTRTGTNVFRYWVF